MFTRRPCTRNWWHRRSLRVAHDLNPDKVWCVITLEDGTLIGETWCRRCGKRGRLMAEREPEPLALAVNFLPESPPTE